MRLDKLDEEAKNYDRSDAEELRIKFKEMKKKTREKKIKEIERDMLAGERDNV